jgi:AMMECR1 domain-containing protein
MLKRRVGGHGQIVLSTSVSFVTVSSLDCQALDLRGCKGYLTKDKTKENNLAKKKGKHKIGP